MRRLRVRSEVKRSELAIRATLERLRSEVRATKAARFPGDHHGPKLYLALIEGFIDTGVHYLDNLFDPDVGTSPEDVLREAADITSQSYSYLADMAGAGLDDLPHAVVPALQRWFTAVGVTNTVFFRARLEENYELAWYQKEKELPEKKRAESLDKAASDISWPLLRVTVPSKAFSYLPHMAIVAHEIGHALYRQLELKRINLDGSGIDEAIRKRLKDVPDVDRYPGKIDKMVLVVSEHWKEELVADAVSHFLAGPAAFFAHSEFLSYGEMHYGYNHFYPPNSLRRRVLHEQLARAGFSDVFKRHTGFEITEDFNSPLMVVTPSADEIFKFESQPSPQYNPKLAALFAELPNYIVSLVPSIYESVLDHLSNTAPDVVYTADKLDLDLKDHLEALSLALPPIERAEPGPNGLKGQKAIDHKLNHKVPVEFASILNIGWAALLTKHSELKIRPSGLANEDCEKMEKIQGLLIKAVELSEALRSWRSEGKQNGGSIRTRN